MSAAECRAGARSAAETWSSELVPSGGNTLLLGEMGIGNTAAAALLMHGLPVCRLPIASAEAPGSTMRAWSASAQCSPRHCRRRPPPQHPLELLAEFGGYEIAMLVGALMGAAARRHVIIVDGFTVTVAAALAARIEPKVLDYCIFGHCSAEHAHRALLAHLGAEPLLDLGMRSGEGSGAAIALPVVRAAVGAVHADGDLRRRRREREELRECAGRVRSDATPARSVPGGHAIPDAAADARRSRALKRVGCRSRRAIFPWSAS